MACCPRSAGALSLALVCLLGSAPAAIAQTYTWNTDADASWNNAGNWSDSVIPNAQGITAIFGGVITANRTVTVDSPVTVGNITFQETAFSYTIGGFSTLTLDNGASPALVTMTSNVGAHQRIQTTVTALSDIIAVNDNSSWRLFFEGGINLGAHTFSTTGAGIVTVSQAINGTNGLVVQNGPGELRLHASNSGVKYVINNGTMVTANVSSVLSAASFTADLVTINNNATLRFEREQDSPNVGITLGTGGGKIEVLGGVLNMEFGGVISGSTALTKVGAGKIALTGTNIYTGDTIIRDGTIRVESNVAPGVAGPLGNSNAPILVGDNVGANITGLLAGGTSPVTVSRDISVVASAAPGASTVTIGSELSGSNLASFTGTLTLNRSVVLTTGSFADAVSFGRITGMGGVTVAGSGITRFTSTASDFTGTITLGTDNASSGTLEINADNLLGNANNSLFFNGGVLRITGSAPFSTNRAMVLGHVNGVVPSGIIDVQNTDTTSGYTLNAPITGDGPFRKTGPGILTLSAANTHGYSTYVEQGMLRVTGANFLSPNSTLSIATGASVQFDGFSQRVPGLQNPSGVNPGSIDLGSSPSTVLTLGHQGLFSGNYVFTGGVTGTGNLVKTGLGQQQLAAAGVNFTGLTTVQQGVLEFTNGVASGAGKDLRLGDPGFSSFDAVIFGSKTGGIARPFTVVAGTGTRTIGHQLSGNAHNGSTVTFSGPITLEKDLQLYSKTDFNTQGSRLEINGVISGSGGLVKIGGGPATLAGDNTFTGQTTILKGQLIIGGQSLPNAAVRSSSGFVVRTDWGSNVGPSFNLSLYLDGLTTAELAIHDFSPNPNRIGDVDVTLSHGKFTYWGPSSGVSTESFHNLAIDRGPNTLQLNTGTTGTASATINLTGGLVRSAGGGTLVVVSQNTLGNPDGGPYTRVLAAAAPTLIGGDGAASSTNISIIPWAYHDTDPNSGAATTTETFLTYGPTGLRPLADSEYVTSLTAGGALDNVRIIATSASISSDQTINSLRYGLSASGTITLNNNAKLTVNSGAILSTSSGTLTFTDGEIAFGANEGFIHTSFGSNVVINSIVSGSGGLTSGVKSGSLVLNGANTYTGPTTINSGGITFNSAASFGAGGDPIRNRDGTGGGIIYSGFGLAILPNPIEIGTFSTDIGVSSGGTLRLTGTISGTSSIITTNTGSALELSAGTGTIELRAANTFIGSVMLTSGTLGVVANNNFGAAQNELYMGNINHPALRFDSADVDLARTIVVGGNLTFNTNGFDATVSGSMIGGQNTQTFTKTGAGILTLTGLSTSSVSTAIVGGTLRVNGELRHFSTAGGVNVNAGGALGGSGLVDRTVTVDSGGTLAPGAGVGTLTVRALAFGSSANAAYEWEAGPGIQDQIVVTNGPLDLTGVNVTLKLYDRGLGFNVTPEQQFHLITIAGTGSITGFNPANFTVVFADSPSWSTSQYSLNVVEMGGNSVLVLSNISPVPEPAGLLAVAGAALGLAAGRQRRGCVTRQARRHSKRPVPLKST